MAKLVDLKPEHYQDLYRVVMISEPYMSVFSFTQFASAMRTKYEGWVVVDNDLVIGSVLYSDFSPQLDILLHVTIDPRCHGRWVTRGMLRQAFDVPFNTLMLPRVSGYCVVGVSDYTGLMLQRLGFKEEGIKRKSTIIGDNIRDVKIFGMLREECRWIT